MTKKRILIVEDQGIIAMDEEQIIHDLGYVVTSIAMSGEAAIQQAARDQPDLILMDIFLAGDIDGREAARKIRELYQIPVVFVTAYGNKEQSLSLKDPAPEGIGYIVKPFTRNELESEIERLISSPRSEWDR